MATSGSALGISIAIYTAVIIAIFTAFSVWRRLLLTRKFYSPNRFKPPPGRVKPQPLSPRFGAWVPEVVKVREADILRSAGVDAAMYIKILRMGWELFMIISVLVLMIILPINLTSGNIDKLNGQAYDPESVSQYMYWLPAPPSPGVGAPSPSPQQSNNAQPKTIKPPQIYNSSIPPAPAGTIWYQYNPGVPPLPPVTSLGPGYENYVWFYDQSYTITEYTFTNLDKTTMANVQPRSSRLYAHALMTWLISFVAMWQFWRYSKVALRMRMLHLLTAPRGVETHTVLCTDVPGVNHGTIPDRLDGTLLRLVPNSIKKQAMSQANKLKAKSSMLMPGNRAGSGRIDVEAVPGVMPAAAQPGQPGSGDSEGPASGIVSPFAPLAGAGPTTDPAATVYPTDPGAAAASSKDGAALPASDPYDDGVITADEFADMNAIDTDHWEMPDRWEEACDKLNAGRSVQDMAHEIFRQIYADDLSHVHVVYNTSKLDPLVATYQKMKSNAERAVDVALTRAHAGKKMKPKTTRVIGATMGQWGKDKYGTKPKKVDAFEYYADRMEHLWGCIQDEQENARRHAFPSAFVTFKKRTAQVVAGGALMSEDLTTWRCQAAPRVQEVLWSNLGMRSWERSGRVTLMWISFFLLCAFFMIPVTAVQAILSTNSLVSFIDKIPIVNSIITAIIPGLALTIFLALLPSLLRLMKRTAGVVSEHQIDHGVVSWYFIFQVITVFFGSFVAGTFANQFETLIKDPGSIVQILGTAAPQAAIFFLTFVLVRGMLGIPFSILRIVGLIIFWIKMKLASTPRAKRQVWANPDIQYGTLIPEDTITILLGLVFCVICPLIAPAVVVYFSIGYIVRKYNALYVFSESYQSGGLVWLPVFNQLMTALILFQLVMICLMAIKKTVAPPLIVLPLVFISLAYMVVVHNTFNPPMQTLSLLAAADRDKEEEPEAEVYMKSEGAVDAYVSPSFTLDEDEHREVVQQCRTVAAAQASDDYSPLDEMYEAAQASAESDASDEEGEGLSALKPKNWKKGNASPV